MALADDGGSSVVICTKDRTDDLLTCIASLEAQTVSFRELIIVDASGGDRLHQILEEHMRSSPLPHKYLHTEPSTTRQRNLGAEMAAGERLFFFDDDVVLQPDYHEKILEAYRSPDFHNIGGVTGRELHSLAQSPFREMLNRIFLHHRTIPHGKGRLLPTGNAVLVHHPQEISTAAAFSGFNMSFPKDVFMRHKFDENMTGYALGEDVDLSLRIGREHCLLQTPFAGIYHNHSPRGRDSWRLLGEKSVVNHYYIFRKNFAPSVTGTLLLIWVELGFLVKALVSGIPRLSFQEVGGVLAGYRKILTGKVTVPRDPRAVPRS
jgi:GT2 family glycosyltransferase